jgi:hypothetical protein
MMMKSAVANVSGCPAAVEILVAHKLKNLRMAA